MKSRGAFQKTTEKENNNKDSFFQTRLKSASSKTKTTSWYVVPGESGALHGGTENAAGFPIAGLGLRPPL